MMLGRAASGESSNWQWSDKDGGRTWWENTQGGRKEEKDDRSWWRGETSNWQWNGKEDDRTGWEDENARNERSKVESDPSKWNGEKARSDWKDEEDGSLGWKGEDARSDWRKEKDECSAWKGESTQNEWRKEENDRSRWNGENTRSDWRQEEGDWSAWKGESTLNEWRKEERDWSGWNGENTQNEWKKKGDWSKWKGESTLNEPREEEGDWSGWKGENAHKKWMQVEDDRSWWKRDYAENQGKDDNSWRLSWRMKNEWLPSSCSEKSRTTQKDDVKHARSNKINKNKLRTCAGEPRKRDSDSHRDPLRPCACKSYDERKPPKSSTRAKHPAASWVDDRTREEDYGFAGPSLESLRRTPSNKIRACRPHADGFFGKEDDACWKDLELLSCKSPHTATRGKRAGEPEQKVDAPSPLYENYERQRRTAAKKLERHGNHCSKSSTRGTCKRNDRHQPGMIVNSTHRGSTLVLEDNINDFSYSALHVSPRLPVENRGESRLSGDEYKRALTASHTTHYRTLYAYSDPRQASSTSHGAGHMRHGI